MDKFKKKYLEEANELNQKLEAALLQLDPNNVDDALIQEIFRIMHTIKGNSAMFGYKRIDEFTHHIETIYDLVRNNKVSLCKDIINFSFTAVDHINQLLNYENDLPEDVNKKHEDLLKQVVKKCEDLLDKSKKAKVNKEEKNDKEDEKIEDDAAIESADNLQTDVEQNNKADSNSKTFYIYFKPNPEVFQFGNNPLFLIEDIVKLGKAKVFPYMENIPNLKDINPELCYVSWKIFLETEEEVNEIKDVFIFVEDDCEIEIIELKNIDIFNTDNIDTISNFGMSDEKFSDDIFPNQNTPKNDTSEVDKPKNKVVDNNTEETADIKVEKTLETPSNGANNNNGKLANNTFSKETISSIRVDSAKLDVLMNIISELVTLQARLSLFATGFGNSELSNISENMDKVSRRLRDNAFSICLIPIETMLTRFQRLVRDVSAALNKDVKFVAEGTETELDKSIIESLADPIMHIIRNSLDHGLETPERRIELGKPAEGVIKLQAYYSGTYVYIDISDDGKGIDTEAIKEKAISKGIISSDEKYTKRELLELIFAPGLTTAKQVTDLSGRGVGMDVVKRKISDIRGEVEIDSEINVGTTITIKLPLTLSIIDGLLVEISNTLYLIPLRAVNNIFSTPKSKMNKNSSVLIHNGEEIPYVYLRNEFNENQDKYKDVQVVAVNYNEMKVGLVIDKVIGEYQAVLKSIGKIFKDQDFISGATILGDGSIALVLDTNRIIRQFAQA